MPEKLQEILPLILGALFMGYVAFEVDRRQRQLRDLWDVLDGDDAAVTARLEGMVESGELQPYTRGTLA
jgi:hypothetical protein